VTEVLSVTGKPGRLRVRSSLAGRQRGQARAWRNVLQARSGSGGSCGSRASSCGARGGSPAAGHTFRRDRDTGFVPTVVFGRVRRPIQKRGDRPDCVSLSVTTIAMPNRVLRPDPRSASIVPVSLGLASSAPGCYGETLK